MKTTLVIPTLNNYAGLNRLLGQIQRGHTQPEKIVVIDNGGKYEIPVEFSDWIWMVRYGGNLGVAGSCNKAMHLCMSANSWWIHSNDDIEIEPDTFAKLIGFARDNEKECKFFIPEYGIGSKFTLFMAEPQFLVENIGLWDEQFYPAYMEDNCYGYRMKLAGIKQMVVPGCKYVHHTSSTIKNYSPERLEQHHKEFRDNRARYIAKWGGEPEHETFTIPYNGEKH